MVNKTGLELSYKDKKSGRTYTHNPDKNILMFSPEDKQCPEITLSFSDSKKWSSYVSLKDSVGNDRRISLNSSDNCVYDIGISIQFAKFALTKLVIITPYYLISNQFSHDIKIIEEDHALGDCISVPKGQVVPFWPQINSSHVMIDIGTSKTAMFNYKETESLVLRLSEEPLAVCVDLQSTENSHVITVSSYYDSCAPVVFVNLLQDATIIFQQDLKGPISEYTLAPGEAVHYTWDDPTGSRLIRWRIKSGETDPEPVSIDISKVYYDGEGSFTYSLGQGAVMELSGSSPLEELSSPSSDSGSFVKSEDNVHVQSNEQRKAFWKSFAVNAQIAILFTDSMEKLDYISSEKNDEICNAEVNISLGFVGLSLVDNKNKKELAYIALKQHGVMWQVSHENGSWELLDSNYIQLLEEACKELQNDVATDGLVVNLESMEIYEPMRGKLQRTCYNGVHVNIKIFERNYHLNASIGYIQVDGPLLTCMLYPLPSVTSNEDCKPFLEATIIMHKSSLKHFKCVKVSVQNFALNIEFSFIKSLLHLFSLVDGTFSFSNENNLKYYILRDIEYTSKNLVDIKSPTVSNLFDVLHIDAVEVKLSFSISTGDVLVQVFKEDTNFSLSDSCFKLGKKLRFEKLHMKNVVASCYKSGLRDVRNIIFMVLYILIKVNVKLC
jgi:vacuolar protein sorting-associated protein 13A/C